MSTRGRTPTKFASWDDANEGDFDRFVWNKTTDPLFGDSNNAKALRKRIQRDAPELILQSPHHSHDRYFPSAVLNVPGLKRYLPDPATISEYCSASRGPQCYDRLGKPYKCHFAKGIPAFLYTWVIRYLFASFADRSQPP